MKNKGFTLIELIVVITILAILGTIAFISFKGFSGDARNAKISADLSMMHKGLTVYKTKKGVVPIPDNTKTVKSGTVDITFEGEIGNSVKGEIGSDKNMKNPSGNNYKYATNKDRKKFTLIGEYEEDNAYNTVVKAENNLKVFKGDEIVTAFDSSGNFIDTDLKALLGQIVYIGEKTIETSGNSIIPDSCSTISKLGLDSGNKFYDIKVNGSTKKLYCDMTNGGWTLVGYFEKTGTAYSGGEIGDVSIMNNTPGQKVADEIINSIDGKQFRFEGVGTTGSEYLYCKKYNFDYSKSKTVRNNSVCSREFNEQTLWYTPNSGYGSGHSVSHRGARDVWLRGEGDSGTRWQTTKGNPSGFITWYSVSQLNVRANIKMWIK